MHSILIHVTNQNLILCKLYNKLLPQLFVNNSFRIMSSVVKPFKGVLDRFNGIRVNSLIENCELEDFSNNLEEALKLWQQSNIRGIWFQVAIQHSDWIPILAKKGFNFHHAKPDFVMMLKWISKEESNVPSYAHTMIGVGAVVVNNDSKVLVVRERFGFTNSWKLPGGYVEPGENLIDAAIREVYEETHISTEFHSVLTLRQGHGGMFGCSDIYVVVSLIPTSTEIEKCDREIGDSQWMKIEDYLQHENVHELNKFFLHTYLNYKSSSITVDCKHGIHQLLKKPYTVYYATQNHKL